MAALTDFIQSDFPEIFFLGFSAGFLICSAIYGIRAAVAIATKIFNGRR